MKGMHSSKLLYVNVSLYVLMNESSFSTVFLLRLISDVVFSDPLDVPIDKYILVVLDGMLACQR